MKNKKMAPERAKALTMTIVIPAHNESEYIGPLLESLRLQTEPPDEVIVVCDYCTDDTELQAIRAFSSFPAAVSCSILTVQKGDIAAVRNAGIRVANGDVIVCLDADVIAHETMVDSVRRAVGNGAFYGGFGLIPDRRFGRQPGQIILNRLWLGSVMLAERFLGNFIGSGIFFRRVDNLLFDEAWGWAEDIEFSSQARRIARNRQESFAYLGHAPLVYCDRRFIENGYLREIVRRLTKGVDHLRRATTRRIKRRLVASGI